MTVGALGAGAMATGSKALGAAAAGTSVMTGPGAGFAAGATTFGADAGTAMDVLCERMTPTTATQMIIASADAIAARRMDRPPMLGQLPFPGNRKLAPACYVLGRRDPLDATQTEPGLIPLTQS